MPNFGEIPNDEDFVLGGLIAFDIVDRKNIPGIVVGIGDGANNVQVMYLEHTKLETIVTLIHRDNCTIVKATEKDSKTITIWGLIDNYEVKIKSIGAYYDLINQLNKLK